MAFGLTSNANFLPGLYRKQFLCKVLYYVKNKRILMILLEFILTFDCEETRNEKNRKHEESI